MKKIQSGEGKQILKQMNSWMLCQPYILLLLTDTVAHIGRKKTVNNHLYGINIIAYDYTFI